MKKYELMESCPHGFIALIFTCEGCAVDWVAPAK